MSVRGVGEQSIKVTAEREHDGPVFCVGPWVRDHLLMFDLGYFRYTAHRNDAACDHPPGPPYFSGVQDSRCVPEITGAVDR